MRSTFISSSFLKPAKTIRKNAYTKSRILSFLKNTTKKRIAFLDIDSTMTGSPDTTNKTRLLLETLGYRIVYVSTRTEEMLMTQDVYEKSIKRGSFTRPYPNLAKKGKKHRYIAPEAFEPVGLLNPDIIVGSTGTQILIRQHDGAYIVDHEFEQNFSYEAMHWKDMTLNLITQIDPQQMLGMFSEVDHPTNYHNGHVNVAPPQYRIGLSFTTLSDKLAFIKKLQLIRFNTKASKQIRNHVEHIHVVDDSHPRKKAYRIYLTPQKASKAKAVEHIVHRICKSMNIQRSTLEILLAGDSFPDLEMGTQAGLGTKATFLLVGGSRLTEILLSDTIHEFAGEQLLHIKQALIKKTFGTYQFTMPNSIDREIVIGDEAYTGKIAIDSIYYHLRKQYLTA